MSTKRETPHGLGLWWTILFAGSGISAFLNVWHALHQDKPGTEAILGLIFAGVPVGFAALLSHGLVSPAVETWFKWAIVTLFFVSMVTSIASQADVLRPYGGGYGAEWSVPLVLDASALLALHYVTKIAKLRRETAQTEDREAELAAVRAALRPAVEAEVRAGLEADMSAMRADMEADIAAQREALEADMRRRLADMEADIESRRDADISRTRSDIEADVRARAEADMSAMKAQMEADKAAWKEATEKEIRARAEVEIEARLRREMAAASRAKAPANGGQESGKAAPKAANNGLSSEERARILIQQQPNITGAELGRALGMTERQGRRLRDRILADGAAETLSVTPLRAVN